MGAHKWVGRFTSHRGGLHLRAGANSGSPWGMPSGSKPSHCNPFVNCRKSSRTYPSGISMSDSLKDSGISVSGYISLDIAKAAGADITEALNKWDAETPIPMYAGRTPPAIVANPPVMMACSSDMVTCSKKGLTKSGASVCDENYIDQVNCYRRRISFFMKSVFIMKTIFLLKSQWPKNNLFLPVLAKKEEVDVDGGNSNSNNNNCNKLSYLFWCSLHLDDLQNICRSLLQSCFISGDKTLTLQEVKVVGKNGSNFICC